MRARREFAIPVGTPIWVKPLASVSRSRSHAVFEDNAWLPHGIGWSAVANWQKADSYWRAEVNASELGFGYATIPLAKIALRKREEHVRDRPNPVQI